MDRKIYAVVVAGGSGTRMGSDTPKQFLRLAGLPILRRTIENLVEAEPAARVVTVLPRDCVKVWKEMCIAESFDCGVEVESDGVAVEIFAEIHAHGIAHLVDLVGKRFAHDAP